MKVRERIADGSLKNVVFSVSTDGYISAKLGKMTIVQNYCSLEDCREATEVWLEKNKGLQVEY